MVECENCAALQAEIAELRVTYQEADYRIAGELERTRAGRDALQAEKTSITEMYEAARVGRDAAETNFHNSVEKALRLETGRDALQAENTRLHAAWQSSQTECNGLATDIVNTRKWYDKETNKILAERDRLASQIDQLATYIMEHVPGEPSESEGAVECAIQVMRRLASQVTVLESELEALRAR